MCSIAAVSLLTTAVTYRPKASKMKKALGETHCALAVVRRNQKFSPAADPLPGGAKRPKFNQLEMEIYLQTQFGEDRCTLFRVIVVTDPQTHTPTHKQTGPITIHCAAASAQCNYVPIIQSASSYFT